MRNNIECPNCGNMIVAYSNEEPQKCRWCKRLFKVTLKQKNKEGSNPKYIWLAEPVDFVDKVDAKKVANYNVPNRRY